MDAVRQNHQYFPVPPFRLIISVGASPQVTSIQNFTGTSSAQNGIAEDLINSIRHISAGQIAGIDISLELHAGVYSVLDLQQLATKSRSTMGRLDEEIAISVIAEVISIYNDGERQNPEALVAVGTLGLGREPCQSYSGWGVASWVPKLSEADLERKLIVKRISQEHSILSWDTVDGEGISQALPPIPLEVGQYVRIYPNHACITGAMYDWYFVIDSSKPDTKTKVIDVWMRSRGW